jgi:hypothetical protein
MVLSFLLSLTINFSVIGIVVQPSEDNPSEFIERIEYGKLAIYTMGFINAGFSGFILLIYVFTRISLNYKITVLEHGIKNPGETLSGSNRFKLMIWDCCFKVPLVISMILQVLFCFLGIYHSWYWFSICLLLIVNIS